MGDGLQVEELARNKEAKKGVRDQRRMGRLV